MKFSRFFILALFAISSFTFNSCNSDDGDDENCLGVFQGSWKVNGVEESSYFGLIGRTYDLMTMTFSVCPDYGNPRTISFTFLDYPPVVGTQEIREGQNGASITAKCYYSSDDGGEFYTDTVQMGTFTITSVNTVDRTLSATFQLNARSGTNASQTIAITEGELININYPN
jgi:hypothetical protein